jgi:hypothetical protein
MNARQNIEDQLGDWGPDVEDVARERDRRAMMLEGCPAGGPPAWFGPALAEARREDAARRAGVVLPSINLVWWTEGWGTRFQSHHVVKVCIDEKAAAKWIAAQEHPEHYQTERKEVTS